jgi:hypothetical protein
LEPAIREIMIFLHSHGVGTLRAVRIFKTGADAIHEGHYGLPLAQLVPMAVRLLDVPAPLQQVATIVH